MKDFLLFVSNFVKNPLGTGAIAPSSRFLTEEITSKIDFENSRNIVELGPGLGTFTKAILKKSKESARIFSFEVNKDFCSHIGKAVIDNRLVIINESAENIGASLKKFRVREADCVVSGLPFLDFPEAKKRKIIKEVKNSLGNRGRFILFQYTSRLGKLLESNFRKVERSFVLINMPPAFVYVCEK